MMYVPSDELKDWRHKAAELQSRKLVVNARCTTRPGYCTHMKEASEIGKRRQEEIIFGPCLGKWSGGNSTQHGTAKVVSSITVGDRGSEKCVV